MNVQQPTRYPLSYLIQPTVDNLKNVKQELGQRGWAFFHLDNVSGQFFGINNPNTLPTLFDKFANWMKSPQQSKNEYRQVKFPENRFGYFNTSRKEGYRFMTGYEMTTFGNHPCNEFIAIAAQCDKLAKTMLHTSGCGMYLFNVSNYNSLANLPLLNPFSVEDNGRLDSFGLFDIVKYYPANQFPTQFEGTDSQVNEHADPGLFSISFGSSAPGLEMFDPTTNVWYSVPNDVVVLWCGHAVTQVSNGTIKPGIHRVKATNYERVTAWYEVCTREQIPTGAMQNIPYEVELELLKRLQEESTGVSMSKSGIRRSDPIFSKMRLGESDKMRLEAKLSQQNRSNFYPQYNGLSLQNSIVQGNINNAQWQMQQPMPQQQQIQQHNNVNVSVFNAPPSNMFNQGAPNQTTHSKNNRNKRL